MFPKNQVSCRDDRGKTPVMVAAMNGHVKAVARIILLGYVH
jgi:ankyrin repeat protein